MKGLLRGIVFYAIAIYITSLIIPGFNLLTDWRGLLLSGLTLAFMYTFVNPLLKFLLLPINILTLGLFSFLSQVLTFYLFLWLFPDFINIEPWRFAGFTFTPLAFHISSFMVNRFFTIVLSTFFISFIVSLISLFL